MIVGFTECKIGTDSLSPRRDSPGTDMGRHLKSAPQGITKEWGMPG